MADVRSIGHGVRFAAQFAAQFIPQDVGQQEREDRLVEWARLSKRAADPSVPADLRKAYGLRAHAILKARPRDRVAREHAQLIAKSALVAGPYADQLRELARQLIEERHPPAERGAAAAVRKAKQDAEDLPVPVFDADGHLIGVCDPGDIMPVAGASGGGQQAAPAPAGPGAVPPGAQVAKGRGQVVYDQWGRPHVAAPGAVRTSISKSAGTGRVTYKDRGDGTAEAYDAAGRMIGTFTPGGGFSPVASPEAQARNTGPANVGGTTGMGMPRKTGPAASSPANGPQRALPGDAPGREVIKGLGPQWTEVHDWTGALVGAVRRERITSGAAAVNVAKSRPSHSHANVYDSSRRRVGIARLSDIIPLADLR